ncbi:unnamed protein product, partial [Adineta steineri]
MSSLTYVFCMLLLLSVLFSVSLAQTPQCISCCNNQGSCSTAFNGKSGRCCTKGLERWCCSWTDSCVDSTQGCRPSVRRWGALTLGLPYNQPRFSSCAIWDINATTVIGSSPLGSSPYGLFINNNNTLYVTSRKKNNTQIWPEDAGSSTSTFSIDLAAPAGIFVTDAKDVYIDNGLNKNEVIMWPFNQTNSIVVMNVSGRCHSLFIDINNTLYCSMGDLHQIVSKSLNDTANTLPTIIAGNGSNGLMANLLSTPCGIFVDTNFDLYVA